MTDTTPTSSTSTGATSLLDADLRDATTDRNQADVKAIGLLAAAVAILGFEVAWLVTDSKQLGTTGAVLVIASIGVFAAAGLYFGAAIYPATPSSLQWGFVHAARISPEQLVVEYQQMAADPAAREGQLAEALHHQGSRVLRKYELVRRGLWVSAVGVLVGIAAGVIATLT